MSYYGIKTECDVKKCKDCGGDLQHDPEMKTYYCTECGQIDESLNLMSTWSGSLGSTGVHVNELGDIKGNRGKKWPGTEYKTRQRNKLRDKMKTISSQLGFNERLINEVMTHLDSYFNYQLKCKSRPKKVATFKTLGLNQACQKACCVIQYLVARKHRMALSIPEVCTAWNLQMIQIGQLLRHIERVQKLSSATLPAVDFIPRIISKARVIRTEKNVRVLDFEIAPHLQKLSEQEKEELIGKCKKLLAVAECCNSIAGRSAITIACAVLHLSCDASKMSLSQDTLCRNYEITASCLNKRVRETKKQLLDLMEEQTGSDMSKVANGSTFGWLIEHSEMLINLKFAKNKHNQKEKNALKRKLDAAILPSLPPPKRKKTNLAKTLLRQKAVAKAYVELKKEIPDFKKIEVYEDKSKMSLILEGANVSKTDLKHVKLLLQCGVSPSDIIQSQKPFHQMAKEHEKKPVPVTQEDNSDGSELDDIDDSDLDQYFRD